MNLTWTLQTSPQRNTLVITYRLTHTGPSPIHVLDLLTVFGATDDVELAPSALIVRADPADPRRVLFTRGYIRPTRDVSFELEPGARTLAPGASLEGHAEVPLPLQAWHPNDDASPLGSTPEEAVLELGYVPGDAPLRPLPALVGGSASTVQRPRLVTAQRFIRSEPRPLPSR